MYGNSWPFHSQPSRSDDKPQHIMYGNKLYSVLPLPPCLDKPQHIMYGNCKTVSTISPGYWDKPQHIMYGNVNRKVNKWDLSEINLNI